MILIVEDEALVREVAILEFEDAGFDVVAVADGDAALQVLAGEAPIAVLFTDVGLRDSIDGWTVAARARALRPDLAVIYATGHDADAVQVVPGGRFFNKPYEPAKVIAAVREIMAH